MTEGLKPCPFCGGSVQTWRNVRDGKSVTCRKCGVSFTEYNGRIDDPAEYRLALKWNTRAAPQIKPLVWVEYPANGWKRGRVVSVGPFHHIISRDDAGWVYNGVAFTAGSVEESLDVAKSAAQTDHETSILEALL